MTRTRKQRQYEGHLEIPFSILRFLALALTVVYKRNLVSLELGVALMVGYSALLIPRNIYCEGWRPEAIDHAAEVLRTIANDRMAEIEADNGQVKEPWETHDYIH